LVGLVVTEDRHLHSNGPFGKSHPFGSEPSPTGCNRPDGLLTQSTTVSVGTLDVSKTKYLSYEQIIVSWQPLAAPCQDDFVGIYFSEIPSVNGKTDKENFFFFVLNSIFDFSLCLFRL